MKSKKNYLRVPYGCSVHNEEEIAAVVNVLKTSTQMGRNVRKFEEKVAKIFDKKYGIMLNSGSSALLLAFEVLDLPAGSEVITPTLTFGTTVSCLVKNNLVPAFVDVEEGTYCIDPAKIGAMITDNTKAVCIPNLIGNIAKWDEISRICEKYDLKIIEDSADTLGATLSGRSTGYYSDISITSFYGSHVINAAGNGGMICVNSEEHLRRLKVLRSWGRSSSLYIDSESIENRFNVKVDGFDYDEKFVFEDIGYNFEPSEMGAAFGLVQFDRLEDNIKARINNFNTHQDFFRQFENWFILSKQTDNSTTGWLAYPLVIKKQAPFTRRGLQIFLEKRGIQTRVIFTGNITRQPGFKNIRKLVPDSGLPIADDVMRGGILIGCHHGLTGSMIKHIHTSFNEFSLKYN